MAATTDAVNGYGSSYAAKHSLPSHYIGGNRLNVAESSKVKDFVAAHDGHSVITSVSKKRDTVSLLIWSAFYF
jgi:acetyl-CoA carboxylase/biotin carboxylase 1